MKAKIIYIYQAKDGVAVIGAKLCVPIQPSPSCAHEDDSPEGKNEESENQKRLIAFKKELDEIEHLRLGTINFTYEGKNET